MSCCIAKTNTFVYEARGFDEDSELTVLVTDESGTVPQRRTWPAGSNTERGSGAWGPTETGPYHPDGQVVTITASDTTGALTETWQCRVY